MSKPTAGDYYIINRVLSPTGDKLAITFNRQGEALTITPFTSATSQKWTIVDNNDDTTLGAPDPPGCPTYSIRGGGGKPYTIYDGLNGPVSWTVATAANGTKVARGENTGDIQEWILQSV